MPAINAAEQARADAYLEQLRRLLAYQLAQRVAMRGDDDRRRDLGQNVAVPLKRT